MIEPQPQPFVESNLDPAELEQILRRIDENLELRPLLNASQAQPSPDAPAGAPPLPEPGEFVWRLQGLQNLRAPLFVIYGRSVRDRVKQALNLPIKLFGRKQILFNRDLLEALQVMVVFMQDVRRAAEYQLQVAGQVQQHDAQLTQLALQAEGQGAQLEQLARQVEQHEAQRDAQQAQRDAQQAQREAQLVQLVQQAEQREARLAQQIGELAERGAATEQAQGGVWARLEQIGAELRGTAEWITLLERKHQMLALDVRERIGQPAAGDAGLPEPQILDPEQYQQRLAAMGDQVRVNLASGEKPWPDYINVDFRPVPQADVLADVRRLPFEPGSLAEIASAHLVEHFREHQFRTVVLPYWKQLLRPNGALRIICPNWQAMLDRLQRGEMPLATFKLLTFGGQDYEGDDHFAMYTPETLSALLRGVGFQRIQVLATDRMNGLCPEMELVGYL
ncbi:MAG: hypothetical protein OHK0022_41540 [Roseiflexaceae bacterium]